MIETAPRVAFKPNATVEEWLTSHGVEFMPGRVMLSDINTRQSLQNQARFQPLDESLVVTYGEAMASGDRFPPVVLLSQPSGYLVIDGNHRVTAAALVGLAEIDAYIVENLSERTVSVLTFDANTKHGLPTSAEERKQHAVYLVETAGITQKEAAQMLNVPERALNKSIQLARANRRLTSLGVERWQNMGMAVRERLQAISNDHVFKAAAELTILAKFDQETLSAMVTEINKTSTETDALAVVEAERERQKDRIDMTMGGRASLPQSVTRLSRSLSYAERVIPEDFDKKILDPKLAERYRSRLEGVIATYQAVLNRLV